MAKIDAKLLEGLTFTGSEGKTAEKDGRKVKKNIPFERPLAPEDVLDFKEVGDTVVIVAKDGRKHTVKKNGETDQPKGDDKRKK